MNGIEIFVIIIGFTAGYWVISKVLTILKKPPVIIGKDSEKKDTTKE